MFELRIQCCLNLMMMQYTYTRFMYRDQMNLMVLLLKYVAHWSAYKTKKDYVRTIKLRRGHNNDKANVGTTIYLTHIARPCEGLTYFSGNNLNTTEPFDKEIFRIDYCTHVKIMDKKILVDTQQVYVESKFYNQQILLAALNELQKSIVKT